MSILRLEDLFFAGVFVVAVAASAYSLVEPDEATPLVTSASVVMERSESTASETRPAVSSPAPVTACSCPSEDTPMFVTTLVN